MTDHARRPIAGHQPRVAYVTATDPRVRAEDTDRPLLVAAAADIELDVAVHGWDEPDVDWAAFDLVVIRSVWDYPERLDELLAWLAAIEPVARLQSPAAVIRWNLDKRYLGELAAVGIPVVPTAYATTGSEAAAAIATVALDGEAIGGEATGEVVVKPTISAGSRDTGRFARHDPAARALADRIVGAGRTAMVQPAVPSVAERGEVAHVLVDGRLSHAYRKGPLLASGGGLLSGAEYREVREPLDPPPGWIELAHAAHDAAVGLLVASGAIDGGPLLHARVDLVARPGGEPAVLEVELFEPMLSVDLHPSAPGRVVRAWAGRARQEMSRETSTSVSSNP